MRLVDGKSSWSSSSVARRVREELALARAWVGLAVPVGLVMLAWVLVLSRNIAFYRYPWEDLGFELLPQISDAGARKALVDLPLTVALSSVPVLCALTLLGNAGRPRPKPHAVNVCMRLMMAVFFSQVLRSLTFLATSLPGSSDWCLSPAAAAARPTRVWQLFTRLAGDNCGDLVFSGHVMHMTVFALTFRRYAPDVLDTWVRWPRALRALAWAPYALVPAQALLIVASRHHYTSTS
eukprot:m51a1_g10575 hypothetical protein (237) ;mRNA; f:59511-60796